MSDGKVVIETILDSTKFKKGLAELGSVSAKGLGVATKSIAAVGTGLTGMATMAVQAGIKYESAFAGVKKTVNATSSELKGFSDGIRDMAKNMPESADQIASVAEAAGQLGIKNKSLLSFTKTMTQLGDATNMSSNEAADSLARFANITGMSQDNFDRLGSTIVALGNNLATTESEITAMSMRIAGAGHQVGMTESQIMSFSGALSSVGIDAEAGGTAFSTLISKMNLATSKGGKDLSDFASVAGMSSSQFKQAFEQDASQAILSFIQGLGNIKDSGGSAIKTLDDMGLSDIRMRDALLRASGASDTFTNALNIGNDAWNKNNALTNEVKNRYSTLESKIAMMKNSFNDLGITIYQSTRGPLNTAVTMATEAADTISKAYAKGGSSEAAKAAGTVIADMAVTAAKGLPKLAEIGGKAIKAFAQGVIQHKAEIGKAAANTVRALASGIAAMLPKELGNSLKNMAELGITAAKPMLKLASACLKGAAAASKLAPELLGVIAILKLSSFLNRFHAGLLLIQKGQEANTKSTLANTLATKLNAAATKANTVITKEDGIAAAYTAARDAALTAVKQGNTVVTVENTVATNAYAVSAGIAAAASNALAAAIAFCGGSIGIAIIAVGALAGAALACSSASDKHATSTRDEDAAVKALSKSTKSLTESYNANKKSRKDQYSDSVAEADVADELKGKLIKLSQNRHKSNEQIAQEKLYVDQLNKLVPGLNLKYDEQADKLNMTTAALKKKIAAVKEEAKAEAAKDLMVDAYKDQIKAESKLTSAKKTRAKITEEIAATQEKVDAASASGNRTEYSEQSKKLRDLKADLDSANDSIKKQKDVLSDAKGEVKSYSDKITELYGGLAGRIDKVAKEAGIKSKDIPKSVYEGVKSGSYAMPKDGSEFKALLSYDKLNSEATKAGLKIPKEISNGIKAGGAQAKTATDKLQSLVSFQSLYNKAKKGGAKIPDGVYKGVISGKYKIPKSIDELKDLANFDRIASKAKKSGIKVPSYIAAGIKSGKMKPKKAADEMQGYIEFTKAVKKAKKDGVKIPKNLASSVASGKTSVTDAMNKVDVATRKQMDSDGKKSTSSAKSTGKDMILGIISGIQSNPGSVASVFTGVVKVAIAAAKKAAGIHSPSKVTRDQIGKMLVSGVNVGVKAGQKSLEKTAKGLMDKAIKAAKNPKGNYEKIGKSFTDGFTAALTKQKSTITKKANAAIDKAFKGIKGDKGAKKAAKKLKGLFSTALSTEFKKLSKEAQKNVEALSEEYQEKYDDLVEKQTAMREKLESYGDFFTETSGTLSGYGDLNSSSNISRALGNSLKQLTQYQENLTSLKGRIPDDLMQQILGMGVEDGNAFMKRLLKMNQTDFANYVATFEAEQAKIKEIEDEYLNKSELTDINTQIDALNTYQENLNALKARNAPATLMEQITEMDTDTANKYMGMLLATTDDQWDQYVTAWNTKMQLAKDISESYYKDQFTALNKSYSTKIAAEMKKLKSELKQIGKNVMNGFISGVKSMEGSVSSTIKGIVESAVRAAKKSLKIKSPSRVFKEIGVMSIRGAEVGVTDRAENLYKTTTDVAETFADKFAKANLDIPEIYNRAKSIVASQVSKIPIAAQIQTGLSQAAEETGGTEALVIHTHADIDGREVASTTARFTDRELGTIKGRKERGA